MTIQDLEARLADTLTGIEHGARVKSYQDARVLTNDRGLVLRCGKDEFQITIVRSGGDDSGDEEGGS